MSNLQPGQPVYWHYTAPRGWNETLRVHAEIVKVNPKSVTIKAFKPDGSYVLRTVKPEKIEVKTAAELNRQP